MNNQGITQSYVLHWNYRNFTEFPIQCLRGEESSITDIYLKENLISRLPCEIEKFIHLESLYLSGNDISELPVEISMLRHLKCLDVSGNRLREVPEVIGELKNLKFLILDENELMELPRRLTELRKLRYLSVCDNKLKWLPQKPVHNYYHCEFRFWRNVDLRCIPYSLWYHMFRDQQTRSLNIGFTTKWTYIDYPINLKTKAIKMNNQGITQSYVLHWNYRNFTEFPIQCLRGEESSITDIYLKENLISRLPCEIEKFIHLESLYLSGNDISELPVEISMLRHLKCLDVSGNRLREVPEVIGELKNLKFLILDENELMELPRRLTELRKLRYLSVCDNKLKWLPQKPVHNYYHCEFRFWRNVDLRCIPYSLWYHMFRDQQTRSLNIGCLDVLKYQCVNKSTQCRVKLSLESREWAIDVDCPRQHRTIMENSHFTPPSLLELCKRVLYLVIADSAKRLSTENYSLYSETGNYSRNYTSDLENYFNGCYINGADLKCDHNRNCISQDEKVKFDKFRSRNIKKTNDYYVAADIVNGYFGYLPNFIKEDLTSGPISRCENVNCKKPVFDYVYYEFCLGKMILIDNTEDLILSATFCSKQCADAWKSGKANVLTWTLK